MRVVNILNGLVDLIASGFAFSIAGGSLENLCLSFYIGCGAGPCPLPLPSLRLSVVSERPRGARGPPRRPCCVCGRVSLSGLSMAPAPFPPLPCRIFAILLLAFELRIPKFEPLIKKWFGFMFTYSGRTAFLLL